MKKPKTSRQGNRGGEIREGHWDSWNRGKVTRHLPGEAETVGEGLTGYLYLLK